MPSRLPVRRISSYLLIAGGALFFLQGARDVVEARWGQYTAEREFSEAAPPRQPAEWPASHPAAPQPRSSPAGTPSLPAEAFQPAPGDTVAKLIIPRLNAELYVVEGTDTADLRRGPGHLIGTAMPGEAGNCVIAGHRDTHFRILRHIHRGDSVILQTRRGRFVYHVSETEIVSPDDTDSLRPSRDGTLHLITCYPFYYVGAAPKRMIVEARLSAG